MSNCIFGWPVYSDESVLYTPALSGGSWQSALPLTNLQDRRLHRVARSSGVGVTTTVFTCDLQTARAVRCLVIPKHNLSSVGKIRGRGMSSPLDFADIDFSTGWSAVVGTPTRSPAALTSIDGVPLDLIGDDDAGSAETFQRTLGYSGNGTRIISCRIAKGTGGDTIIQARDQTAAADRMTTIVGWSGTTPNPSMLTGSLVSNTLIGSGVYRLVFLSTSFTAANDNVLNVAPASGGGATGDVYLGDWASWQTGADPLVYDAGYMTPWPTGLTAEDIDGLNVPYLHIASAEQSARYWRMDVYDPTNTDGYVELSRLLITGAYQPSINMSYGAMLGLETETSRNVTDGGAALYNVRPVRRTLTAVLDNIAEAEAFGSFWEMQKRLGTSGQFFFVYNPADTTLMHDRAFLAVFRELSALEHPYLARHRAAFSVVEEL